MTTPMFNPKPNTQLLQIHIISTESALLLAHEGHRFRNKSNSNLLNFRSKNISAGSRTSRTLNPKPYSFGGPATRLRPLHLLMPEHGNSQVSKSYAVNDLNPLGDGTTDCGRHVTILSY